MYIYIDNENLVLAQNHNNMSGNSGWLEIDEALPEPLLTADNIPLWKLEGGTPIHRTETEIEADRAAIPAPPPSDHDLLMTLLGVIR